MLLPREQSPWNCGYYLGAIALEALKQSPDNRADLQGLQQRMGNIMDRDISPTQAITAAAWLYLAGVIELDENGMVRRCS
jgi:hypothetical protein